MRQKLWVYIACCAVADQTISLSYYTIPGKPYNLYD